VSTVVFLHAHPDDESIATGGSISRAVHEGHRVVLVMATDGRHGETPADLGDDTLPERRRRETEDSARILGVDDLRWLGYHDSGMTGWAQNQEPLAFVRADVDDAARRLADVLDEVAADVIVCYDWHGGYGHPDHIQVHRVGHRAAQILAERGRSVRVLESTMNRSRLAEMIRASGESEFDPDAPADDGNPFGTLEDDITMAVDVSRYVEAKRASIACHASQVTDSSIFLQMPPEMFTVAFGTEWFIEPGQPGGAAPGWFM